MTYKKEGRIKTRYERAMDYLLELIDGGVDPDLAVQQVLKKFEILLNKPI